MFVLYGKYEGLYAPNKDLLDNTMAKKIIEPFRIRMVLNISCPELFNLVECSRRMYWNFCDSLHGFLLINALVCGCSGTVLALWDLKKRYILYT